MLIVLTSTRSLSVYLNIKVRSVYSFYDALTKVSAGFIVFGLGLFIVSIVMFFQVSEQHDTYEAFGKNVGKGAIVVLMLISLATAVGAFFLADYSHMQASISRQTER